MPKKQIEHFYMMTVAMYIHDLSSLSTFIRVNKKCQSAALTLKGNPNLQDSLYYRKTMSLRQRVELFKKEMRFYPKIDTLRGSFSLISRFFGASIDQFELFELYYEGCGDIQLFKRIQSQITQLEFVCNGRFVCDSDMPLLKKFKVVFMPTTVASLNLHTVYVKVLVDYIKKNALRHLDHFILVTYDVDSVYLPLLEAVQSTHPDCQIGICVKGNVDQDFVASFLRYGTVISTSPDALFYGSVDECKVVAVKN